MLSAWAAKAAAKRDVALVCVLRTHLAYLFRDTTWAEITDFSDATLTASGAGGVESKETKTGAGGGGGGGAATTSGESKSKHGDARAGARLGTVAALATKTILSTQVLLTSSLRVTVEPSLADAGLDSMWHDAFDAGSNR